MNILQSILQSKTLERAKRYWGKKTGLHIRLKRFTPSASEEMRTAMLLQHMGITHVIDIGANTGQFAESLYDFGYTGHVVSFEPVSTAYQQVVARSKKYPNWQVAERCAIGSENGTIDIHVSDDTVFSSILGIKDSYVAHNPKSKIIRTEKTPVYALDEIAHQYIQGDQARILLKIDTQGYEKQVLDGAQQFINRVSGLKIEMPLYPIYENAQFNFYDIVDYVKEKGFQPYSFHVEGVDLNTGRVNTIDGLFFRD
ncbi:MAG TPA: FkbM family methyltransferase [Saprospiraceae bacterium]|nr:FkbM family methyltransferase [Saprospiraceae bacterium]HMQ85360.1 FkbM family methyltransferase [Saprospiraceae bacterium]